MSCGGSGSNTSDTEATRVAKEFVQRFVVERRLESALELASSSAKFHLPNYYRRYVVRGDMQPIGDVELQLRCRSTGFGARSSDEPCYAVKLCGEPFLGESRQYKTLLFGTLYLWIDATHKVENHAHVGGGYSFPADKSLPDELANGAPCAS